MRKNKLIGVIWFLISILSFSWVNLVAQDTSEEDASLFDEDVFELSPFVVTSDEDDGYMATQTLAGTRIRTDLRDVGAAISVVTEQFLTDTGSVRADDLLVYTTNTEVAGPQGNFLGGGDGEFVDLFNQGGTRVRGLAAADQLRDFFLTDVPWDSYNVDRVDVQRGPNAVLFGIGSPAGIINTSSKVAAFDDLQELQFMFDNFGTTRYVLDVNREIIEDELAVRAILLDDNTKYRQEPAYRDDRRFYITANWKPSFFNSRSTVSQLVAKVETGKIKANYPLQTPPQDLITPWFEGMNKATFPLAGGNDLTQGGTLSFNPYLSRNPYGFHGIQFAMFSNRHSSLIESYQDSNADTQPSAVMFGIATYGDWAYQTQQPGYKIRAFKAKSLTDPNIFDFYNNMLFGPNKFQMNGFDTINLNWSQTFMNNKFGYELVYDRQATRDEFRTSFSSWGYSLGVDIIETLDDGTPNPNLGRPFTIGNGSDARANASETLSQSKRVTLFGEHDFAENSDSWLMRFLGKHIVTATWTDYEKEDNARTWQPYFIQDVPGTDKANDAVSSDNRRIASLHYLGDSLLGASSAADGNIGRITTLQEPYNGSVTIGDANGNPIKAPLLAVNSTRDYGWEDRPYIGGSIIKDEIESYTLVWQAHLLGGHVIPMYGYRKDEAKTYNAGNPTKDPDSLLVDLYAPDWKLPSEPTAEVAGITRTQSLVVKVPEKLTDPLGMNMSFFYNKSSNFQPKPGRRDILGNFLSNPSGETKDYGVNLELMDGKILVRVNRYETKIINDDMGPILDGIKWHTLNFEAVLMRQATAFRDKDYRRLAQLGENDGWGVSNIGEGRMNYGVTSVNSKYGAGNELIWQPVDGLVDPSVSWGNGGSYTQAAIDAQYDIQRDAVNSWFENLLPQSMVEAWGMDGYGEPGYWAQIGSTSALAATGSTISKGTEVEITARPVKGLDVTVNFSKTDATRVDLAGSWAIFIEERYQQAMNLPLGHMRAWGEQAWNATSGNDTLRDKYEGKVMPQYRLARALEGTNVPELRPWRFNAVANYTFQDGNLAGANIGVSYRWQDKQVIGFGLNDNEDGYDINKKYYGPTESAIDLWASKKFEVNDKINWRVQLNVRNIFASDDLIPVTVQADGSPGAYRIPEPRRISITNTIEF